MCFILFGNLFSDTVAHATWRQMIGFINILGSLSKEAVMAQFWHLPGGTEKTKISVRIAIFSMEI
jgi:hypothetical protein